MKTHKIYQGVNEALPGTPPDDWFIDDLMDMASTHEEKVKAYWMQSINGVLKRVDGGEFDSYLENLFKDWENSGFQWALEGGWKHIWSDEVTWSEAKAWAADHCVPKPLVANSDAYSSTLVSLITNGFINWVWPAVEDSLKSNPYKWDILPRLSLYAGDWLEKNGYVVFFPTAKLAIDGVVEEWMR